jgi:hypothetical protein
MRNSTERRLAMAKSKKYRRDYSFTGFQNNAPSTPLPATKLDAELDNVAAAIDTLVAADSSIRREDGQLQNGLVTFESLTLALQLMLDPTNADFVANAVAAAQAAAASATADKNAAAGSAASAHTDALAAAASAATVNLSLYLAKANNLEGLGSVDTSLTNLNAAKWDGTNMQGRLAEAAGVELVTNWNDVTKSGWYAGNSAANLPVYAGNGFWVGEVIAYSPEYVTQTLYPFAQSVNGTAAVVPHRRHSFPNGIGGVAWSSWQGVSPIPVGTTIYVTGNVAPPGFLKENGALIPRSGFPALTEYALGSGNIVDEATWNSGQSGSFSFGDLATTIRIPDSRGEFIRSLDEGRGVDLLRGIGSVQSDLFRSHTHPVAGLVGQTQTSVEPAGVVPAGVNVTTTVAAAVGGAETRPRNIAKLACIKY